MYPKLRAASSNLARPVFFTVKKSIKKFALFKILFTISLFKTLYNKMNNNYFFRENLQKISDNDKYLVSLAKKYY